jgi:outer membrane protein assembly factor BamB
MNRRLLIGGALAVVALGVVIGVYVFKDDEPVQKRGSATVEFDRKEAPRAKPKPASKTPWPTYAFDQQRTHVSGFQHKPPFRTLWRLDAGDTVEFPPSVGYGKVFIPQQKGRFVVADAKTGRIAWQKRFKRCIAASPALARGVVYLSVMDYVNCPQGRAGASGFVQAMDARTGRKLWRFKAAPVESSPLLVKNTLYVGSWDHKLYAINAKTGRKRWAFEGDDRLNTSPAYSKGRVFIAGDGGSVFAVNARTGRKVWQTQPGPTEFFYATPTVAYGRVFIPNTNGTMYALGERTGKLLWAKPLGSYVYAAAGVYKQRVYTGTYDGKVYALSAATGDVKWQRDAPSAVHAAPTIMGGLVYFATCATCGSEAQRTIKSGPDGTLGYGWKTGRVRYRTGQGKYANPIVADEDRVYLTGRSHVYGLKPLGDSKQQKKKPRSKRQ